MINRQVVDGRYDDLWGPAILCVMVVAALIVSLSIYSDAFIIHWLTNPQLIRSTFTYVSDLEQRKPSPHPMLFELSHLKLFEYDLGIETTSDKQFANVGIPSYQTALQCIIPHYFSDLRIIPLFSLAFYTIINGVAPV